MNANELAYNQLTHVVGDNNNGEEVVIALRKPLYPESFVRQQQAEIEALESKLFAKDAFLKTSICLTKAEIESGFTRVQWAEVLITQLPEEHEGRNSWLLNYGKAQEK